MARRRVMPMQFFTPTRLAGRVAIPRVLFHWTRGLENALQILRDGYLRGCPGLSTSENPALISPGPVVFALAPRAIIARGFTLWPYLYSPGYEQEAEWLVGAPDAERDSDHIFTSRVELPLRGVVRMIGHTPGWGHPSRRDRARALRAAARGLNIPVGVYRWEEWWSEDGPVVRRNPGRRV